MTQKENCKEPFYWLKSLSMDGLFLELEECGCDPYYFEKWAAVLEEIKLRWRVRQFTIQGA